ncbi:MAG: nucleotidyltransferase family protein [Deltaproteobacteria bacterium]|nr:nucleotidyltransferase family protein [Deltaproteobacteria bacterium]MBW2360804.1 nucleotidyltransferase family protein [Deltaproteobacteria bacterium]
MLACCRQHLGASDRAALCRAAGEPLCWEAVLATALGHQIAPLILENLEQCGAVHARLPAEVARDFAAARSRTVTEKRDCARALESALRDFRDLGIDVMLIKGAALDRCVYEKPWFTSTSDVDLCLRVEWSGLAPDVRRDIETRRGEQPAIDAHAGIHPDLLLHGLLQPDVERVWKDAVRVKIGEGDLSALVMSVPDQLLFACIDSGGKHFFRLKSLCGIGELVRRHSDLDWDAFGRSANSARASGLAYTALAAAGVATGCELPEDLARRLRVSWARAALIRFLVVRLSYGSLATVRRSTTGLGKLFDRRNLLLAASLDGRQLLRGAHGALARGARR